MFVLNFCLRRHFLHSTRECNTEQLLNVKVCGCFPLSSTAVLTHYNIQEVSLKNPQHRGNGYCVFHSLKQQELSGCRCPSSYLFAFVTKKRQEVKGKLTNKSVKLVQ